MQSSENKGMLDDSFINPAEIIDNVHNSNVLQNTTSKAVEQTVQNTGSVIISQVPQSHSNNSS